MKQLAEAAERGFTKAAEQSERFRQAMVEAQHKAENYRTLESERDDLQDEVKQLQAAVELQKGAADELRAQVKAKDALLVEAREAIADAQQSLVDQAQWHGAVHEPGCPEDDTCRCKHKPMNDRLNSAYARAADVLSKLAKMDPKQP